MSNLNLRSLYPGELSYFSAGSDYPFVVSSNAGADPERDLQAYIDGHSINIKKEIDKNGAILFRGFNVPTPANFEHQLYSMGYDLYRTTFASVSPRSRITDATYTSTDAPGPFVIGFHTELPYQSVRPSMISFYCDQQPEQYGETPIFDCAAVFDALSPELQEKLRNKQLSYTRFLSGRKRSWLNFRKTWMDSFVTEDKDWLGQHLDAEGIEYSWDNEDNLSTRHVVPAVIVDPESGRECLNVAIFNGSSFAYNIRHFKERYNPIKRKILEWFLYKEGSRADSFLHTTFGDGEELSDTESEEIQSSAWKHAIVFRWLPGDMMVLNNIRFAHARLNVIGKRRIVTAMGDRYDVRTLPHRLAQAA